MSEIDVYAKLPYQVILEREQCTDGSFSYVASCQELPGCMSHGDTREEANQNFQEAKKLYIESLLENNQEVPTPINKKTFTGHSGSTFIESKIVEKPTASRSVKITKGEEVTKAWDLVEAT